MLTLTEVVVDEVMRRVGAQMARQLQRTGRNFGRHQTSNIELVRMYRELMPIADPLIIEAHHRITTTIWPDTLPGIEEISAAQSYLHQWHAVLQAQALQEQYVLPRLSEIVVAECLVPCAHGLDNLPLSDYSLEYDQIKAFTDVVVASMQELIQDRSEVEKANQLLEMYLIPLIILTRMLNKSETLAR